MKFLDRYLLFLDFILIVISIIHIVNNTLMSPWFMLCLIIGLFSSNLLLLIKNKR